jgi:hypothetical protein
MIASFLKTIDAAGDEIVGYVPLRRWYDFKCETWMCSIGKMNTDGFVRENGLGYGTHHRQSLGSNLAPLSQGDGTVLLKNISALEMEFEVEVVVDRGMDGG